MAPRVGPRHLVGAVADGVFAEFLCALGEEDVGERLERREAKAQFEVDVGLRQANGEGVVVDNLQARHLIGGRILSCDCLVSVDRLEKALLKLGVLRRCAEIPCANVVFGLDGCSVGKLPVLLQMDCVVLVVRGVDGLGVRQ